MTVERLRFDQEDVVALAAALAADDRHIWQAMAPEQRQLYTEKASRALIALSASRRERGAE